MAMALFVNDVIFLLLLLLRSLLQNGTFTDRLEAAAEDVRTNIRNASEVALQDAIESREFLQINILVRPSCIVLAG